MTTREPMMSVDPGEWLQATAKLILGAEGDVLLRVWNVSENITQVRGQLVNAELAELRAWLGLADALVEVAVQRQDLSLLDYSLIGVAQVLERDVSTGRFAIVGMMMLLSPPLAHAETFRSICHLVGKVPAGATA